MRHTHFALAGFVAGAVLVAPLGAQDRGSRQDAPTGAEIAQAAKATPLDEANRLTAQFQGKPITFTPAAANFSLGGAADLRAGRFVGVLHNEIAGDETGLPPGTYNLFVAQVGGKWRAFAESNGTVVREAIRVRFAKAEGAERKPRFREKGWGIDGAICCVEGMLPGGELGDDPTEDAGAVVSVVVSPATTSIGAGQSVQLKATPRNYLNDPLSGLQIGWTSSNPAIATVGATGLVQAMASGTATLTAIVDGVVGTAQVTVTAPATPTCDCTVKIHTPSGTVTSPRKRVRVTARAERFFFSTIVLSPQSITWSSSDPAVAIIAAKGTSGDDAWADVEGIAPGGVEITATHTDKRASVYVRVTSDPVVSVTIAPTPISLVLGKSVQLTATVLNELNQPLTRPVTWASSDPALFTVSATGLLTGVKGGSGSVMATSETVRSTAAVTVTVPVSAVVVTPSPATVVAGGRILIAAALRDAAGTALAGRPVAWTTGSAAVATIVPDGVLTGVAPGTTTVSGTSEGVTGTVQVTVQRAKKGTLTTFAQIDF